MGDVQELRLVLTVSDFEAAVALYRDALGLAELADWSDGDAKVVGLDGGRASLELINEDQASPLSRNVKAGAAWEAYNKGPVGVLLVEDFNQSLVTNKFRTYNHGLEVGWKGLSIDFGSIPQAKNSGLDYVKKITLGYRF